MCKIVFWLLKKYYAITNFKILTNDEKGAIIFFIILLFKEIGFVQ